MIHLLPQDSLLALGWAGSLSLFLGLKRELSKTLRRLADLAAREPEMVVAPAAPRSGLNLNKRVQATRLLRRGQDIAHIAAALGLPVKEVELLARVQAMAAPDAGAAASRQPARSRS